MGVFKVLMWKHYTVRKRRFFQTFIEFFSPVSIVFVLFLLKDDMLEKAANSRLSSGPETSEYGVQRLSLDSGKAPRVLFIPDTKITRALMEVVNVTLEKPIVTLEEYKKIKASYSMFPEISTENNNTNGDKTLHKTLPMSNSEILSYDAIVKFENMNEVMPDKLNYTIRVKPSIPTGVPYLRSHERFVNVDLPFLKLQWAIDSAFLKLKSLTGKHRDWQVSFEELPQYPTRRQKQQDKKRLQYVNTVFLLLPYVSFFGPLLPFIFLMIRLLEERSTGIQELVKMVGVSPTMLGLTQFLNSLPSCLIFSIGSSALLKSTDTPMVPETIVDILFIGFFLHFISMIAMAYACSYIVREAEYTVSLAMFVYIGMWIPIRTFEQDGKDDTVLFLLGLLPHCPTYWYMNEIHTAEVYFFGTGITYKNWNTHYNIWKTGGKNGTVRFSFIMQLIQIFYLFLLSWYMERVRPGKYGIALPWNFPFTRDYWQSKPHIPKASAYIPQDPAYEKYFEKPPANMEAGIKIEHVSKIFGSGTKQFQALSNVNLEIFKGEITVLLGHNGAGKTTLISIITGMYRPSSGRIYVNGMDTVTQQQEVRKHMGLCPQHNLFFPDLTVREHFMFFSLLKGGTFYEAKKGSDSLMEQLDLKHKADSKTSELSGGMLRRLQLGCALCGNASVLILDEPTSGLDVEARRQLWDMLLALRGNRTLLLTTHFMEEADVLGDRLAALHAGKLRCHATPMFLKRAVGSGFRLSIITAGPPDEATITKVVKESAPEAFLKEKTLNSLIYDLPAGTNMPVVFNNIDSQKKQLNIESMGIGITTLEEVFVELCCDVEEQLNKEEDTTDLAPVQYQYIKGFPLILRQTTSLFRRQYDFTRSKIAGFVILQIIMPFLLCITITVLFNNAPTHADLGRLSLDLYSELYEPNKLKALYRIRDDDPHRFKDTMEVVKEAYPEYEFRSLDDFPKKYKKCTCNNAHERNHRCKELPNQDDYILGVDINRTQAKVLYKPTMHLAASIGLNLLSNVLAAHTINDADGRMINVMVSDDFGLQDLKPKIHVPKIKMNCALFATFNIFIIMATAINDVTLPCRERLSVARHTHVMAGCPPALYWLVTFIWHMCCYTIFCVSGALIAAALRDKDMTIDDKDTLTAYTVALVLCGMDFYAFAYFVSYYFNDRGAGLLLIGFTVIFGFLSPILMMGLEHLRSADSPEPMYNRIMNKIGVFLPAHMFTDAVSKMTDTSRFNSFCKHNFDLCPALMPSYQSGFDKDLCCSKGTATHGPFSHYAFTEYAMGSALVIIVIQFLLFATIVLLMEYGYFNQWWTAVNRRRAVAYPPKQFNNEQVAEEKKYDSSAVGLPKDQITDCLLMSKCYKTYFKLFGKPTFALRDENFSIKKGECFGILGANGAGKTTTFKLISLEESATKGKIFVHKYFQSDNRTKYMQSLGYCPQFFGLDDFRSGENNLRILLELGGFSDEDVERETKAWLEVVAMAKYGSRAVVGYSGGMVRRLATSASLCRGAPLTLLDEPTSGVDTAARRLVWTALRRGVRNERSVLFTSHNMDEIELLCQRVMILSSGEVCVLGSPAALKEEFAPGSSVVVKLRAGVVQGENGHEKVRALKRLLEQTFQCTLKDEHLTTLYYRITEQLSYNQIFSKMEEIEKEFRELVEDYSVSDTTLEDVFLSFK